MLNSHYRNLGAITLPVYQGRNKYMHTFDLGNPVMAVGFEDYLPVVKALCAKAGALIGYAHMTVAEEVIEKGKTQRRPGPHVDGCFIPSLGIWGHDDDNGGGGTWNHYCNHITGEKIGRMPVIVAASVAGCKAWEGIFDAEPASDGDLSHLPLPEGEVLPANIGYLLSGDCVHESLPMIETVRRTFLRIALPVEFRI